MEPRPFFQLNDSAILFFYKDEEEVVDRSYTWWILSYFTKFSCTSYKIHVVIQKLLSDAWNIRLSTYTIQKWFNRVLFFLVIAHALNACYYPWIATTMSKILSIMSSKKTFCKNYKLSINDTQMQDAKYIFYPLKISIRWNNGVCITKGYGSSVISRKNDIVEVPIKTTREYLPIN